MPLTEGAYPETAFPSAPTQWRVDVLLPNVLFPLGGLSLFRPQPLGAHELPQAHWFPELVWGCWYREAFCVEGMEAGNLVLSHAAVGRRRISLDRGL